MDVVKWFFQGFFTALGVIVAIGATQATGAFVDGLREGIDLRRRQEAWKRMKGGGNRE